MKIGIIGCGRIGGPVIRAFVEGDIPNCELQAVLARTTRDIHGFTTTASTEEFFRSGLELIIDTATPAGLPAYGERALALADTWTVNATALADPVLYTSLEACARSNGHRLRILSGAIAGLDGVATLAVDKNIRLCCQVDVESDTEGERVVFNGSVREAAALYPENINVAVAVAFAGAGLDETMIDVIRPGEEGRRNLGFKGESRFGRLNVTMQPAVSPNEGIHTVAASIIATLHQEHSVIWSG